MLELFRLCQVEVLFLLSLHKIHHLHHSKDQSRLKFLVLLQPSLSIIIIYTRTPNVTSSDPVAQPAKPSRPLQGSEESSNLSSQTKKTDIPVSTSTKPSKTFTTERAKTDTNAIALEVKAVADRAILEDLYGTCKYTSTNSKF